MVRADAVSLRSRRGDTEMGRRRDGVSCMFHNLPRVRASPRLSPKEYPNSPNSLRLFVNHRTPVAIGYCCIKLPTAFGILGIVSLGLVIEGLICDPFA